jgi:1,4-dihydroxy-2-naphthoate octaprenyltransferase
MKMSSTRLTPWFLAARPKTLAAAVVPVLVGTALAGFVHWPSFFFALGGALFIQIGTNFVNDALDYKKGADTHERLGPLRVTQAGLLSADAVLRGAYVCFALAAVCGVPLIVRGGWPIVVIGITSIVAAYAYTGGPYPLAYHGLGELFVMVFFGLVAVGGSYYVQRLTIDRDALLAGLACGALAIVLLAINNLRDLPNDRASNKRTMAARFGPRFARAEIAVMAVLPFALAAAVAALRAQWALLATLLALPLAAALIARVFRSEGAALNRCLAMAGALQWAFGILFAIGAVAGWR